MRRLATFVVLFVVATAVTWFVWNDKRMGKSVSGFVSGGIAGHGGPTDQGFTFGSIHWRYFSGLRSLLFGGPTTFEAWNLTVFDVDGNEVIFAPHASGKIWIGRTVWAILGAQLPFQQNDVELHMSGVVLDSPRARIATLPSDKVNLVTTFYAKRPRPPGTPQNGGMRISVADAQIHNATYVMAWPGWHAELQGVEARLDNLSFSSFANEQEPDRPAFQFHVSSLAAPTGKLTMGKFEFPLHGLSTTRFSAENPERQHLAFTGQTESHGAAARIVGRLTDMHSSHAGVDATLSFEHGLGLVDLINGREHIGGDLSGWVRFRGPFSSVTIDGQVDGGEFTVADMKARDVHAGFLLGGNVLHLKDIRSRMAGGRVGGGVDIDLDRLAWKAHLTTDGVDPARIGPLVPLEARALLAGDLAGSADLDGSLALRSDHVRLQHVDAKLTRRAKDKLPHVVGLHGGLGVSPQRVRLDDLRIAADGLVTTFKGELDQKKRTIDADLLIEGSGITSLLRRADLPEAVQGISAKTHVSGSIYMPVLDGTAHATGVGAGDRRLRDVDAHIHFEHGSLSASDLHGRGFGGQVDGELHVGLFDGEFGRRLAEPTLSVHAIANRLTIHTVLDLPSVRGEFSGQIDMEGSFAHPRGSASLELPTVQVWGDPYRNGIFKAVIDDTGLDIGHLELERVNGGRVAIKPHGHVGPHGELNVDVETSDFPLIAIPQLRNSPLSIEGFMKGTVHLGGALGAWIPEGLIEVTKVKLREVLFHDGKLELHHEGEGDIRVSGEFFNRFRIEGRLRIVPHLAGDVTISFDGLPLVDLIPEMRTLSEVRSLASGWARFGFDITTGLASAELHLTKLGVSFASDEGSGDTSPDAGDRLENEGDVIITSDGHTINFNQLHLRYHGMEAGSYKSVGTLDVVGRLAPDDSDLHVDGDLDLRFLEYIASSWLQHTHGHAKARVHLTGHGAFPHIAGTLDLEDARIQPRGADRLFRVPSGRLVFDERGVTLPLDPRLHFQLDGADATADGHLDVHWDDWSLENIQLSVQGELSATLLAWILPDQIRDTAGRFGVALTVGGRFPRPTWQGSIEAREVAFHTKKLGRDVRIQTGTLSVRDYDVITGCPEERRLDHCRTLVAVVDETSALRLDGVMRFGGNLLAPSLDHIAMRVEGDNLDWGTAGVSLMTLSPRVMLRGSGEQLTLSGTVNLVTGRYFQNFDVVRELIFQPRSEESDPPFFAGIPVLEGLNLDVYATSSGALLIKNNLADLNVTLPGLHIAGTLGEPILDGTVYVEPGGRFTIPLLRSEFISEQGTITFESNQPFPARTPRLDIHAASDWQDRNDQLHHINLTVRGTYREPDLDLSSTDGWDKSHVLAALFIGNTPDDLRRASQEPTVRGSTSTSDGYFKTITGQALRPIEDPLTQATRLDLVRLELGYDSVVFKLCVYNRPSVKLCGSGDLGFVSTTRVDARGELKLSDYMSLVGGVEHIEHGVDTTEDVLTRGKLQLTFRGPLF